MTTKRVIIPRSFSSRMINNLLRMWEKDTLAITYYKKEISILLKVR